MDKKQIKALEKHFGILDIKNISKIELLDKIIFIEEMEKEERNTYSQITDYDIWRMNNE